MISEYLNKDNLHHAYLIEGQSAEIIPEIKKFFESLGIKTLGNPDFCHIIIDNFKIDEAFALRAMSGDKSLPAQAGFSTINAKKIFLICANNFSLDAQNVLLKMFEEPIENTHFFLIVPEVNALLKTFVSRFYFISEKPVRQDLTEEVEEFINMPLQKRIDFLKILLPKKDEENEEEINAESNNVKALKFLNALEISLHGRLAKNMSKTVFGKTPKTVFDTGFFKHFFKVREFLRMPGSSVKTLMESVALITPNMLQ